MKEGGKESCKEKSIQKGRRSFETAMAIKCDLFILDLSKLKLPHVFCFCVDHFISCTDNTERVCQWIYCTYNCIDMKQNGDLLVVKAIEMIETDSIVC